MLGAIAPLPDEEWAAFSQHLTPQTLQAGECFLDRFSSPFRAAYVVQGLLKASYPTRTGEEFIRNFCVDGSLAIALSAVLQGQEQASLDIVALERSQLLVFDYREFQAALPRHWTWQQIGRVLSEQVYVLRDRRQRELLTMPAKERLECFLRQFPGLAARISQKDLAAYIGITPVSLSRLRASLRRSDY